MRTALLLLISMTVFADPAADVVNVFSDAVQALINDDSAAFLDHFDRSMPDYAALRSNIEGLLAAYDVGSTIEVVTDEGTDEKRTVSLDWLLVTSEKDAVNSNQQTHRRIVKCTLERRGKQWKITGLEPIAFFTR